MALTALSYSIGYASTQELGLGQAQALVKEGDVVLGCLILDVDAFKTACNIPGYYQAGMDNSVMIQK